jgi:hypothetical protein
METEIPIVNKAITNVVLPDLITIMTNTAEPRPRKKCYKGEVKPIGTVRREKQGKNQNGGVGIDIENQRTQSLYQLNYQRTCFNEFSFFLDLNSLSWKVKYFQ